MLCLRSMTAAVVLALVLCGAPASAAPNLDFPPDMQAVRAALREMPAPPAASPASRPASIWYEPPVAGLDSREALEYAGQAQRLAAQGLAFSDVFAGLCRHLLDGNPRVARHPRGELANMFRGLIRWTRNGGRPAFQGREDWPLHLIYGGYIAVVYGQAAADAAAYAKEVRDSRAPGNFFDLGDYAVTLMGARWVSRSGHGTAALRRWAEPWASGQRTLSSLPAVEFVPLPHGRLPTPSQIHQVRAFVRGAL